jgi:tRNA pseudouridine55 synthase
MNGVLIVDKPQGKTSFDVVTQCRRWLKVKKAGHTGTLDPMATGLLALCLGDSTRLVPFLTDGDKTYEAEARLGAATDTQDRTGRVTAEAPFEAIDRDQLVGTLERFRGEIQQTPPMYSAISVDGVRLYKLARKGEEIERPSRPVEIHELELLGFESPLFRFRVRCSKGTYVRTLAHDVGEALGCHAHLTALRRTASGPFCLEQAIPLEQVTRMDPEEVGRRLIGDRDALLHLTELQVPEDFVPRICSGQKLRVDQLPALAALREGQKAWLESPDGRVLAVAELRGGTLHYLRVLATR